MRSEVIAEILSGPHFRPLQSVLEQRFACGEARRIREEIESRLDALLEEHQDETGMLREESHFYILPSIAAYTVLRGAVGKEEALSLFCDIYYVAARKGAAQLQQKAAEDVGFWKGFPHRMSENKTGDGGGFSFRLIQDDSAGAEFHVLRCPYVEFCMRYACEELAPVFCGCDDIVYGAIHPLLRWERDKTLGRGNALCNFKFTIVKEGAGRNTGVGSEDGRGKIL